MMATKPAFLFKGKESKAEEAKEKKAFPNKAAYARAEAKMEGEMPKKSGKAKPKVAMACGGAVKAKKK
jgi:hypothetical protein